MAKKRKPKGDCPEFAEFWAAYPRKLAKQAAMLAWEDLRPDAELRSVILAALRVQCQQESWRREGGQYIPHASTWLNGARWEDEVNAQGQGGGAGGYLGGGRIGAAQGKYAHLLTPGENPPPPRQPTQATLFTDEGP